MSQTPKREDNRIRRKARTVTDTAERTLAGARLP